MNYWLLTTEFPPFFGGGIGTYCKQTSRMLVQNGHSVTVFVNDSSVSNYIIVHTDGTRLVRFNPSSKNAAGHLGHITNLSYEFASILELFIEKEGKPDIIESQEYLGIAYYLLQFKHLQYKWCHDIPVIITMHSPSILYMEYNHVPVYKLPNYWICEMEKFCLQAANQIISPSQFMIEELQQRFLLTNKNIAVIPNPYEPEQKPVIKATHNSEIIFFGKLTVQKGAFKLLHYFKELWESGFDRKLTVIGDQSIVYHPEGISMGSWIKKNYTSYIEKGLLVLEPKIPPHLIRERISDAEVVLIPSMNDNLPYVALEMMGLGNIILASTQGGQKEIIEEGVDGFLFDHIVPDSFSKKLLSILSFSADERMLIKRNAFEKIKIKYAHSAILERKLSLLNDVCTQKNKSDQFPFIRTEHFNRKTDAPPHTLLSVIIPYYNMGAYIEETITSVLQSDHPVKEIIIVNDGSTEEASLKKLKELEKNSFVKIISTSNKGLASARNEGVRYASGDYIAFLDADDKVGKSYYSKAIMALSSFSNLHFCGAWVKYFGRSSNVWPGFSPEPPLILYHNLVNSSALVYKKNTYQEMQGNDTQMLFQGLEDYEMVVRMISQGYGGAILPEELFFYRVRRGSMFRRISKSMNILLLQQIVEKSKSVYKEYSSELFHLHNANGPGLLIENPTLDYYLAEKLPFGGKIAFKIISWIKKNKRVRNTSYKIYRLFKK